jgi:hypothetical protein
MAAAAPDPVAAPPRRLQAGPAAIALFGTNAVGKSTLAAAIADRLERSAWIEIDVLRYQRRGGLVAASRGIPPHLAPGEYQAQCDHAVELALLQTRSYLGQGVSVAIEGFEDGCVPGAPWAARAWAGIRVSVLVRLAPDVLAARWRGRDASLGADGLAHLTWFEARARDFDQVIDGAAAPAQQLAELVIDQLERMGGGHGG